MQLSGIQSTISKLLIITAAAVMMFAVSMMQAPKANASIGTCTAWQNSTYTSSRECKTSTPNVRAIQYTDFGPNDGKCVQPLYYATTGGSNRWFLTYGGSSEATANGGATPPVDCTQAGTTTWYVYDMWPTSTTPGTGNLAVWTTSGSGASQVWHSYNTTCLSNPALPGTVAGKPNCL